MKNIKIENAKDKAAMVTFALACLIGLPFIL